MKVNFLADNLQEKLSLLGKIVPAHSQIPILSSVLLEVQDGVFSLSATDLEFGVRTVIPAKIDTDGGLLVPGKQFIETLSVIPRGKVQIEQVGDQIIIQSDTGQFKFQVIPKEEFPKLFEEKGEKLEEYTPSSFANIFSKLIYAVSQDQSRPHLTGVYVAKKENSVDYVATDGYRMSLKRVVGGHTMGDLSQGIILSPRLLAEGLVQKNVDKLNMYVYHAGNQAILESENTVLVGRLIEGNYPDYEKVIPQNSKTSIELSRSELLDALRASSVFARENANIINLTISLGKLTIYVSSSSLGESKTVVEGVQTGDDNTIAFNIKFVQDYLKSVTSEKIKLQVNSAVEPALFTTPEDTEYLHVIMPVRVQD